MVLKPINLKFLIFNRGYITIQTLGTDFKPFRNFRYMISMRHPDFPLIFNAFIKQRFIFGKLEFTDPILPFNSWDNLL